MALQKTEKIWHNGKLIRWEDATLHVMSHVVHYGSSVFEGVRCYAPPAVPAIFPAEGPKERPPDSATVYPTEGGFTREEVLVAMVGLVETDGVWSRFVRPDVV